MALKVGQVQTVDSAIYTEPSFSINSQLVQAPGTKVLSFLLTLHSLRVIKGWEEDTSQLVPLFKSQVSFNFHWQNPSDLNYAVVPVLLSTGCAGAGS